MSAWTCHLMQSSPHYEKWREILQSDEALIISLQRSSPPGPAAEDGGEVASKPTSLDVLLSLLLSDLGEIQDFGGVVRFFDHPQGLVIQLPGARLCKIHAQIHSGETCPHC